MNTAAENIYDSPEADPERAPVVSFDSVGTSDQRGSRPGGGIFRFIGELRRRRVCRAATIYSVGFWLVCQVVDVAAPALGLPEWTLKLVIVLGLIVFPIALVLSWLIDITPDGLVADVGNSRTVATTRENGPTSRILDCALLAAATVIGVQLTTGLLVGDEVNAGSTVRRVAVEPFRILAVPEPEALSAGLVVQLQHHLGRNPRLFVIDANDMYLTADTLRLAGVVVVDDGSIHVTMTLVDNASGEVTWSKAIYVPRERAGIESNRLAVRIAESLPFFVGNPGEEANDAEP